MKTVNYFNIYIFILLAATFFSCEDVIDFKVDDNTPQLTVDAWLTDKAGAQTIKLTSSTNYFDNTDYPPALGAIVQVVDDEGNNYAFTDEDNDGNYTWTPANAEVFGQLGNSYTLTITYQGETYQASSRINRVPPIDSITYEFKEAETGNPEGVYAQVYARDFVGSGDCYWMRGFKNGTYLNRVNNLTTAYDAGFSAGGNTDGINFIQPIREGINEFIPEPDNNNLFETPPFKTGDQVYVELYSITEDAFDFWAEVRTQLQNGGLFAIPLANVRTNLVNTNPNSKQKVVGFFCTSAVTTLEGVIGEEPKGVIK